MSGDVGMYCHAKNTKNKKSFISKLILGELTVQSCVTLMAKNVGKGYAILDCQLTQYQLAYR